MRVVISQTLTACLVLMVFLSASAHGQIGSRETALPFGVLLLPASTAVKQSAPDTPEVAPDASESGQPTLGQLGAAQARVAELEALEGPYSPILGDALLQTARLAEGLGLTDVAVEFYSWALHNTRINQGLNTDTQRPIVESLLALHRKSGDLSAMDGREAYLYRLNGNGRPPWDVAKLQATQRYFRWRQGWYGGLKDWAEKDSEIAFFNRETRNMAQSVCADPDWAADWCRGFTLQALTTLYLIDFRINPSNQNDGQYNPNRFAPSMPDQTIYPRLVSVEQGAYGVGVRLLEAAIEVNPDDFDLRLALADWRWFQGRSGQARKMYQALYAEQPSRFSRPTPLPEVPALPGDPLFAEQADRVLVGAEVTRSGRPRAVAMPADVPDGLRIRTRKLMSKTRFRPALDSTGETIKAPYRATLWSLQIFMR